VSDHRALLVELADRGRSGAAGVEVLL
jgi:hypothetical protein